ncbi:MAG: flagellar protein FlgN [Lachnospiraceae bacterium]|nr:flagellar protein FlgN [Lachnospiraceae bacterium]
MNFNKEGQTALLSSFVHTLKQLSETAVRLTEAETAKANAASAKEHEKMDSFLKEEQALLLKLRGLEQQRNRQAEELGWKDLTFRQILQKSDPETFSVLSPVFSELEQQLKNLTDAKDSAGRIISARLREFEHILGTGSSASGLGADVSSHFHDRYV